MSIGFKNENMLLRDESGKVVVTVPGLTTLVDVDTLEPLTNADTKEGQKVAIFGTTAPANWFRSPTGFGCWKYILDRFGYHGGYVPVK